MYQFASLLARAQEIREVIRINPTNYAIGLCGLLVRQGMNHGGRKHLEKLSFIFECWPEYSGVSCYPVPAPMGFRDTSRYRHSSAFDCLPKYTGMYGQARIRLLDFIISELEKEEAAHHETTNSIKLA